MSLSALNSLFLINLRGDVLLERKFRDGIE
jgi:hypothetical protein